jgi:multiple sugar transport system substrate-binding protein
MKLRSLILALLLGLPAGWLLAFGPRGEYRVPAGRVVVRYWEKWTGVEQQEVERLVQRFNETEGARQNIWIDYNPVSNVDQRMLIATAGGDPPDLAGLFDYIIPQYADQDALLPLDELVREYGVAIDEFNPVWLDICRYQGRLYALPSTPYTIALYYNRRLFREAGLDPDRPPQTTAELAEYAVRLTRHDATGAIPQLGFTVSPSMLGWWPWAWPQFFDARLWDGQRFHLTTPEALAAYRWLSDMRAQFGVKAASNFEAAMPPIEGAQNPFLSERLAMVFQGPWVAKWIATYAPGLDYAVAPFPSVTAERPNAFASTDVFVIPRGARRPREAMTFLAWLMRQEVLEELCKAHGKVSPYRRPRPEFFDRHPNPYIEVFSRLAESPLAFGYPKMPTWQLTEQRTRSLLESVLRGDPDVDAQIVSTERKVDVAVRDYERMAAMRRGKP